MNHVCAVCDELILEDPHTDATGEDVHADCCSECTRVPECPGQERLPCM